jgi:hypothetical protein
VAENREAADPIERDIRADLEQLLAAVRDRRGAMHDALKDLFANLTLMWT